MKEKKLFKILSLVKSVKSNNWSDVMQIVKLMPSIEVKEKKWNEKYKQAKPEFYPLDLSNIDTWSTYDGDCISLVFTAEAEKVICSVRIYNGDNMGRVNLNFTATLIMPDGFISHLEEELMYALNRFAEDSYEDYLEQQKSIWISNFKSKILEI